MQPEKRNSTEKTELTEKSKKGIAILLKRATVLQKLFSGSGGDEALELFDYLAGFKNDVFDIDPYQHAYNAGVRSVVTFIHKAIDTDVKKVTEILKQKSQEK